MTQMYHHLVSELQEQLNMDMFLLDLRGQGQSKGSKGHIENIDIYLNDIESFIKEIKNKGYKTIHLIAHSLGSLIALNVMAKNPTILGESPTITMSAPFLGLKISLVKKLALKFICNFLGSSLYLKNHLIYKMKNTSFEENDLTKDQILYEKFQDNPLRIGPPTWGWLKAVFNGQNNMIEKIKAINLPILVFLAKEDQVVDNHMAKKVFDQKNRPSPSIKLIEIKDTKHALFLAPGPVRKDLVKRITLFLKEFDPSNSFPNL